MMDFTTPRFIVTTVHGDETGYANHFLLEVDEHVWNTLVALRARSSEMRNEFKAFAEIALSFNGAIVLNDLDDLNIPEHVAQHLEVAEPDWYPGDHAELLEVISKLEAAKEAAGNEANDQPVHLDGEELVVTALGAKHWSAFCRFRLHNGEETLESCEFSNLFDPPATDMARFTPSPEQATEGIITVNAVGCDICQSPAHRYADRFQCSKHPGHVADLTTGIFSDLTLPDGC